MKNAAILIFLSSFQISGYAQEDVYYGFCKATIEREVPTTIYRTEVFRVPKETALQTNEMKQQFDSYLNEREPNYARAKSYNKGIYCDFATNPAFATEAHANDRLSRNIRQYQENGWPVNKVAWTYNDAATKPPTMPAKRPEKMEQSPSGAVLTKEESSDTVNARRQSQAAADEARAQREMAESRKRAEAVVRDAKARDKAPTGTPCKPGSGCSTTK